METPIFAATSRYLLHIESFLSIEKYRQSHTKVTGSRLGYGCRRGRIASPPTNNSAQARMTRRTKMHNIYLVLPKFTKI